MSNHTNWMGDRRVLCAVSQSIYGLMCLVRCCTVARNQFFPRNSALMFLHFDFSSLSILIKTVSFDILFICQHAAPSWMSVNINR